MGGENRRFMLVTLSAFLVLVVAITITTMAFSLNAVNRNLDSTRELMKEEMLDSLRGRLEETGRMLNDVFLQDYFKRGSGGFERNTYIMLFTMLSIDLEDPYYLMLSKEDIVVDSKLSEEMGKPIPADVEGEGVRFIDRFRDKSGDLIYASSSLPGGLRVVAVKDVTLKMEELESPFREQRSDLKRNSLILLAVFICLSLLLVLLVVMPANARYISGPVRALREKALRIMDGESGVEVEVDQRSDYYALQALLDSVRRLMEREAREGREDQGRGKAAKATKDRADEPESSP